MMQPNSNLHDVNIISLCVVEVPYSLNSYFPRFRFYKYCWNLIFLPFKSNYVNLCVLYYPRSLCSDYLYNRMFKVFSHYICYLLYSLDLMVYLLFIISLEWVHQLLPKNSKVNTTFNYRRYKLNTKNFGHGIFPKILTSENVCLQKLMNVRKFLNNNRNPKIWILDRQKPWELKISLGVCKVLSWKYGKQVFSEVVLGY